MTERGRFTDKQRDILLAPINPARVMDLDGISHLAGWDVIAHLNRMFGFEGWDKEILSLDLVYEIVGDREVDNWVTDNGRRVKRGTKKVAACSVGYRCTLRLTIRDADGNVIRSIDDTAMGTSTNQRDVGEAHDLALKGAVTYALKRCAKDLGDQFGLSLYNKGQQSQCVGRVFPYEPEVDSSDTHVEVTVHADGISEGDDGFGSNRGDGEVEMPASPDQPEAAPEPEAPPVREPKPAKAEKPEPTPPEEKPQAPTVDEEEAKSLTQQIGLAATVDEVKNIWRGLQNRGVLDALVLDLKTEKQMALRELMVRRVDEIETGTAA